MIIGIDTSCYTTSIAVIDQEKNLLVEKRRILDVAKGSRGLAQSAALFQHIREGRAVFQAALAELGQHKQSVQGVCVSSCPRPQKDAYMPVFLAGVFAAELLAGAYQTPLYHTSHQEGHLMAGIQTAHMPNC